MGTYSTEMIKLKTLAILALRATKFDFTIKHHWIAGSKIKLNSFLHKSYWYHGKRREEQTMQRLADLIKPGHVVVEAGGHIGYLTAYFSELVGNEGKVMVFEPATVNLPYIRKNTSSLKNVLLEERGVAEKSGTMIFYEDDFSGQNCSLDTDYKGVEINSGHAGFEIGKNETEIDVVRLDEYLAEFERIDFVKIDVEGCELNALVGISGVLNRVSAMMVEVTADFAEVETLLRESGFILEDASGNALDTLGVETWGNVFCLRKD